MIGSGLIYFGLGSIDSLAWAQLILLFLSAFMVYRLTSNFVGASSLAVFLLPVYPFWMSNSLGHPYIAQFFFAITFLVSLKALGTAKSELKRLVILSLLPLIAVSALWSSETSIALLIAVAMVEFKQILTMNLKEWGVFLLSSALSLVGYKFAKSTAVELESYSTLFASPSDVVHSIFLQMDGLLKLATLETNKPFNAVLLYYISALLVIIFSMFFAKRYKPSKLSLILLLSALGSWGIIHLSSWNALMAFPLRYYGTAYIFLFLFLLSVANDLLNKYSVSTRVLLTGLVVIQAFASLTFINTFSTGSDGRLSRHQAQELIDLQLQGEGLDSLCVIGSYWNSYLLDALSEDVIAIPRQGAHVRDFRYLNEALSYQDFLLIRNSWLESFPDTIVQFELSLMKSGKPSNISGIEYCRYRALD